MFATNPFTTVKSYSIHFEGGFTITNNSDTTFNLMTYLVFSLTGLLGDAAHVTDPSVEYALFRIVIEGVFPGPGDDEALCDTRDNPGPPDCAINPDIEATEFGPVPLLAPGDTFTENWVIDITAELKGDVTPVPEPAPLPLFATGLGLMALPKLLRGCCVG